MLNFLRTFIVLGCLAAAGPAMADTGPEADSSRMGEAWAALKYQSKGDPDRLAKVRALKQEIAALAGKFPAAAAFPYWRAQVLSLESEILHSMEALDLMREAKELLEKAEALDPKSSTTKSLLGSIHYEMPGWPMSYGNKGKAQKYLREALALDPEGMDPNFFMGDFLLDGGKAAEAVPYLEKAAAAADRLPPSQVVAGRRMEITEALEKARKPRKK